jgi:hypothetical protein
MIQVEVDEVLDALRSDKHLDGASVEKIPYHHGVSGDFTVCLTAANGNTYEFHHLASFRLWQSLQ